MIKKTCLFASFLLIVSTIACTSLAAETDGADDSATDPAVRMKSWEQHVKLREESIFKDVEWTAVGPRIQGGKIESIWSVKKRKSTLYAGAGSGNLWKSVNNGTTWKPVFESESTFSVSVVTVSDEGSLDASCPGMSRRSPFLRFFWTGRNRSISATHAVSIACSGNSIRLAVSRISAAADRPDVMIRHL